LEFGFLKSFTSFLLAARTEATRMFSTIQPENDRMIAQRLSKASACLWRTKTGSKRSAFSDSFPEKQ
jgi:hypothetical protein